jgi:NADPH:quinone reductase-like Zn-dependent oxidoreductase
MRNVAVCGNFIRHVYPLNDTFVTIDIHGVPVTFGLIETPDVTLDPHDPQQASEVLVQVKAFSCNYRDKSLIFKARANGSGTSFYTLGSEFCGEVVDIGPEVTDLKIGDRVIGDGQYPYSGVEGLRPGLPTNHGSKEYQRLHQAKLIKIPDAMPDEVAAAFPVGAQTTYSMIRKLDLQEGANVLVTAAKSNTSLFAINALRSYPVQVYATTTSMAFADELRTLGVQELILVDPVQTSFQTHHRLRELYQQTGGFDAVIDPFFDLHLDKVLPLMAFNGRYITCGVYDQYSKLIGEAFQPTGFIDVNIMCMAMIRNLQIIGNCIGLRADLAQALNEYAAGDLSVVIDSVHHQSDIGSFFDRTYNARDRFGKVVYRYD